MYVKPKYKLQVNHYSQEAKYVTLKKINNRASAALPRNIALKSEVEQPDVNCLPCGKRKVVQVLHTLREEILI